MKGRTKPPRPDKLLICLVVDMDVSKWGEIPVKKVKVDYIRNHLPNRVKYLCFNEFLDKNYWITTLDSLLKITKEARSLDHNYVIDRFDCDDFSAVLYCYARYEYGVNSIARVVDWTARHSYNVAVDLNGRFWIIEPQNCEFYEFKVRNKKLYKLLFAQIVW